MQKKWRLIWIIPVLIGLVFVSIYAQEQTTKTFLVHNVNNVAKKLPHSYAHAVKLAAPAVVNVYAIRSSSYQSYYDRRNPGLRRNPYSTRPRKKRRYGYGSGVIMNKQGYVLTNAHVVRHAVRVLVVLADGRKTPAKIIGSDPETDLAVLKIKLENLTSIQIGNSDNVHVGDIVLAIGNPFGLGQTVTQGIVSAIGRNTIGINQLEDYIQTDAAINPGNSGGALINTTGKLVGINTGIYSRSGGFQGVGFAIPVNIALNIMNQIIKYGSVKRGWLGVRVRSLTLALAKQLKSKISTGVVVVEVVPKSPAAKIGLKIGDIITHINNKPMRNAQGFLSVIAQREPGTTIGLQVVRKNKRQTFIVKIGTRPPMPAIDERGRGANGQQRRNNLPDQRKQPKQRKILPDDRN